VACPHLAGLHLYRAGADDFKKGCEEMKNESHSVCQRMQILKTLLPTCCVLRVFCAPALWYHMAERGDFAGGLQSAPAVAWIMLWSVPFCLLNQIVLMRGFRNVLSSYDTLAEWPEHISLNRPYHGLASTRCHAANGGFYAELFWNCWIIYQDSNVAGRLAGISIPLIIFNVGMLLGGPVNFLVRKPKTDRWVAETYLLVSLFAVEGLLLLNHAGFGISAAVEPGALHGVFGPYHHWSVWLWNVLLVAQTLITRYAVTNAEELKAGPPWNAGGCDHKEFFFPRFWGLIYICYSMLASFNLWVLGNYVWASDASSVVVA